jgi:hypothetical protein
MLPRFDFQNQVNAIGGFAFLFVAGYVGWDFTRSRDVSPCSARSPVTTMMSLQKPDGQPMTPAEFQARVGLGERGIMEKTAVRRADSGFVLDVALGGPEPTDSGTSFLWNPAGVGKAVSACLAYRVFVPSDFDYANGGTLPGLYGELSGSAPTGGQTGLSTRVAWTREGTIELQANLSEVMGPSANSEPVMLASSANLAKGRWTKIEQEIVFNSPNSKDGVTRMWVDGRLVLSDTAVAWRGTNSVHFMGSLVDVSYLPHKVDAKPTKLTLSPPQLAWQ